jgi:RecB family exonuclease
MTIRRVFLGWERPALAAAADYLFERFASGEELDLEKVVVALPGGRAGRRFLEILVHEAEGRKLRLCPPRIVTAGKLPELLYTPQRPFAGGLVQQLAWIEALRRSAAKDVAAIVPAAPVENDLPAWLSLGEMLGRLHRELAAEALDFPAVAACGARIEGFREAARWHALAEVQKQYLAVLDGLELWDMQTARLVAIRNGECRTDTELVLLGTADLNRSQRMMLDQVAERVSALVLAPEEMADRFDEHGCVKPADWLAQEIPLSEGQMEVVDDPADQAEAVIRAIAGFHGRYTTEQITLGVPDHEMLPYLEQRLRQCELPARYGVGRPLIRSAPYRLLLAVADYVETSGFPALAGLVRHPWVHDWLSKKAIAGDWLSRMDRYHANHMPQQLDGRWQGDGDSARSPAQVYRAIENLCQGLRAKPRPLAQWAQPITDLLVEVFGRSPLDAEVEPDRTVLAACDAVREVLEEHAAVPAGLAPTLAGTEAIRLVLRQVEGEMVPPPPDRGAIELLGWLELPLDDAPALVVAGFNEGRVPGSLNADLFLPNQLRRALGIEDNDRRYARDAYALSLLAASRQQLRLIAGRRSAGGDPLLPSRLLFACDDSSVARRVKLFFSASGTGAVGTARAGGSAAAGALGPGQEPSRLEIPKPRPTAQPRTSMRVTEFRDYLACPYRYYLRHVLNLESLADSAAELDGGAFGSLGHEVLGEFGQGPDAAATDPEAIRACLGGLLDAAVLRHYGKLPMPSILVQVEQLRLRLAALAQWQAGWAAQGWRIQHVEISPEEGKARIDVDGRPMFLRGRIDRIDVHEGSHERMIFDYKFSDRAKTPEQAHRKQGEWIDLQLPLYRHLLHGLGIEGPVGLGYIALPKDLSRVGPLMAQWTEEDLCDADRAAEEVVRRVRAEVFWPPATEPPAFSEEFAAICQDDRFGAVVAAEEAEGGSIP